jgi:hypothetical protein
MNEKWKMIQGYDNYAISDHGRVRNLHSGKLLKWLIHSSKNNYPYVGPWKNGKKKAIKVHHLVAFAFIGPRPVDEGGEPMEIHHKDGNRQNPHVDNLEYISKEKNLYLRCFKQEPEEDIPDWVTEDTQ